MGEHPATILQPTCCLLAGPFRTPLMPHTGLEQARCQPTTLCSCEDMRAALRGIRVVAPIPRIGLYGPA